MLKKTLRRLLPIVIGFIVLMLLYTVAKIKQDGVLFDEKLVNFAVKKKFTRTVQERKFEQDKPQYVFSSNFTKTAINTEPSKVVKSTVKRPRYFHELDRESVIRKTIEMSDEERKRFWDEEINRKIFETTPPNPGLIFHNKLPKCGSSTMNNILAYLSKKNKFNFKKKDPNEYGITSKQPIADYIATLQKPLVFLKHQQFLNFTKYGVEQPTFINVVRHPASWFTSQYYFVRFGWSRKEGARRKFSDKDRNMSINECMQTKQSHCKQQPTYLKYFCGGETFCKNYQLPGGKRKAAEVAKYNVLHNFYTIGVLEHFEDSLKLFEKTLPRYFKNAVKIWKTPEIQKAQLKTKTVYKEEMDAKSLEIFNDETFKEEIELYDFVMQIFYRKLNLYDIQFSI